MTDLSIRIHMLVSGAVSSVMGKLNREEGQDLIEYAMLGGLIAAAIFAVLGLGIYTGAISDMATNIGDCIDFDNTTVCAPGF